MPKVIVIYHSQQFGDTKALAEALAEGIREAGAEVEIVSTNVNVQHRTSNKTCGTGLIK